MCQQDLEIHFCTCKPKAEGPAKKKQEIDPEASEYLHTQFSWTLAKYMGKKDSMMMGEIVCPADKLSEELTAEYLHKQLNTRNIFDFDYSPAEGDQLKIMASYVYKTVKNRPRKDLHDYLSFIFRSGSWEQDIYDIFNTRTRRFQKGIIELRKPK